MTWQKKFYKTILALGDIGLMCFSFYLALAVKFQELKFLPGPSSRLHLAYFLIVFVIWLIVLILLDFYEIPPMKNLFEFFSNLIVFSLIALLTGGLFFFLQANFSPKIVLFLNVIFLVIMMIIWRFVFNLILKLSRYREKIIIIGYKPELKELSCKILAKNKYKLIAHFPIKPDNFPNLHNHLQKMKADLIVLAVDFTQENGLATNLFSKLPLAQNYISFKTFYENLLKKVPTASIDETWFLENFKKRSQALETTLRFCDILFAIIGCLITAIIFLPTALLIKINSKGPIIYKQVRVGKDDKQFKLYKFRTMNIDAEKNGAQWTIVNDPRITLLGRILRALHIDEFPQFINILKGDLSIVGPRPERPEFISQLVEDISFYNIRHMIKPGLTGWAQIKYTYTSTKEQTKEKLKFDLYYLKNRSFSLYMAIILKTISSTLNTIFYKIRNNKYKIYRYIKPTTMKKITIK